MKISLGCGRTRKDEAGWVYVDVDPAVEPDVVADMRRLPPELDNAEEIEAIHAIEHVPWWETEGLLRHWHEWLRAGGRLVVECPDLEGYARAYVRGEIGAQEMNRAAYERGEHKTFLDATRLRRLLERAGFRRIVRAPARTHGPRQHLNLRMEAIA